MTIRPAAALGPTLAGTAPYLRDGGGNVITVSRQAGGSSDFDENFTTISGVTVESPTIYAEAGIAFFNTSGVVRNSRVGPLLRAADATELAARPHGWGIVQTNHLVGASEGTIRREVTVERTLVTGYQAGASCSTTPAGPTAPPRPRSGPASAPTAGSCSPPSPAPAPTR
ncbi:hypothetical protein GKE82_00035 [Conexibacter sp. W3-3-2]|uniref:hypothetical protein n=1 Tax=Conexibacter sp. W3-3-2 TaxID=2675227 RepID=UPI0012B8D1F2|nr:hypothetical protein [Conexibacter sp. W3-3-2]MTD42734.1 hypothetical protein [Conexibacter sp. W3-3-2]